MDKVTSMQATQANLFPSDEAILDHEQSVKHAASTSMPLVSELLPLTELVPEYINSSESTRYLSKLTNIEKKFPRMRRCRRDGNCFFRAFSFGFIEQAVALPDITFNKLRHYLSSTTVSLLLGVQFEKMAFEDFLQAFLETLDTLRNYQHNGQKEIGERLAELYDREVDTSNAIVVYLRLLTSAHLRKNANLYLPFILSDSTNDTPITIERFCQRYVECLDQESDQIHIIALTKALQAKVEIVYLDAAREETIGEPLDVGGEDDDSGNLEVGEIWAQGPKDRLEISMLYRPGHYDLLYK